MDEEGEGSKRRVRGLIQTYKANRKGLKLLSKACKRENVQKRCRKRTEGFCRWLGIWGERDYLMSKVMGVFGITIKDLPWLTVEAGRAGYPPQSQTSTFNRNGADRDFRICKEEKDKKRFDISDIFRYIPDG